MKDYFLKYAIVLAKRYTYRQKSAFINAIGEDFKSLGYETQVVSGRVNVSKVWNLYVGDIGNAKTVFVAAYDTCSRYYLPNYRYYPLNPNKNVKGERLNNLFIFFVFLLALLPLYYLTMFFVEANIPMKLLSGLVLGVSFFLLFKFISGIPAPATYSRNSASVVLIRALAEALKRNNKTAFILVDHASASYAGYRSVQKQMGDRLKGKTIILLDSMAVGDTAVAAFGEDMEEEAKAISGLYSSGEIYQKKYKADRFSQLPMACFEKCVCFACGNVVEREFIVPYTRSKKDYKVDLDRLEKIKEMFVKYCL